MAKVIFTHLYVIVMAIFVIMIGNVLANQYGSTLSAKISSVVTSADGEINDVQKSVIDWNTKILE
ncbi:MAG: hypothetical protein OEW63_06415 [Gammaproteobacteria bacterium]|nr:hypothetical protein [Gammaproteobacteria bacterium]